METREHPLPDSFPESGDSATGPACRTQRPRLRVRAPRRGQYRAATPPVPVPAPPAPRPLRRGCLPYPRAPFENVS
jgi:hypothetical protein